jgi:hypothetical protein
MINSKIILMEDNSQGGSSIARQDAEYGAQQESLRYSLWQPRRFESGRLLGPQSIRMSLLQFFADRIHLLACLADVTVQVAAMIREQPGGRAVEYN